MLPTVDVSANTQVIWPPNQKMVEIVARLSISDNYYPEPLVVLESIRSNEVLHEGDIQGTEYGTSDTQIYLKATRNGNNKEGRIYTITYLAKDGTGNSTRVATSVTVQHE
ncbi:MAG: hypothetical protein OEZ43_21355 [Gammaproteobacteria bacterium]|nr:hypothetical protein [Gammaproteobacteria bacterium]